MSKSSWSDIWTNWVKMIAFTPRQKVKKSPIYYRCMESTKRRQMNFSSFATSTQAVSQCKVTFHRPRCWSNRRCCWVSLCRWKYRVVSSLTSAVSMNAKTRWKLLVSTTNMLFNNGRRLLRSNQAGAMVLSNLVATLITLKSTCQMKKL